MSAQRQFEAVASRLRALHAPTSTARVGEIMAAKVVSMPPGEFAACTAHLAARPQANARFMRILEFAEHSLEARLVMVRDAIARLDTGGTTH
jgi:hypothetical protein